LSPIQGREKLNWGNVVCRNRGSMKKKGDKCGNLGEGKRSRENDLHFVAKGRRA